MKLTYFNLKGRAELARLILAQAEVAYSDCRISKEEWQSLKPSKSESFSQSGLTRSTVCVQPRPWVSCPCWRWRGRPWLRVWP